jgi:hypothetical protein
VRTSPSANKPRCLGLLLLLAGVVLAAGGFALPWMSVTCVANCSYGLVAPTRGPIATDGLFLFICWLVWLLVLVLAVLTAVSVPEFCFLLKRRHCFSSLSWCLLDSSVCCCDTRQRMASPRRSWRHGALHFDTRDGSPGSAGAALPAGKIVCAVPVPLCVTVWRVRAPS